MKTHRSPRAFAAMMAGLLFAMSLLSGVAFADDGDGSTAPAYLPAKQAVADALMALIPTGDEKVDEELEKALEKLAKGLDPEVWLDESTLSDKGKDAFSADKDAVEKIEKAIEEAPDGSDGLIASLDAIVDALVEIDAAMAAAAIDAAVAIGADGDKLAKAQEKLADAHEELADGDRSKAIDRYKKAWYYANKAEGYAVDDSGDSSDPTTGDADKWSEYTFWFINIETGEESGPLSGTSHPNDPLGYTGKSNEGYLMVGDELMQLHVSCSDAFPDGVGAKSDPSVESPWRVDRYTITKYSNGEVDKTCGLIGLVRAELAIDKSYSSDGGATYLQGGATEVVFTNEMVQFRFVVTNTGNVDVEDVSITDDVFGALTAANSACNVSTLAVGESFECTVVAGPFAEGVHANTATGTGTYEGNAYEATDSVTFTVQEEEIV